MTQKDLERSLRLNSLVRDRVLTLRLAEKINPEFKYPCILGGFLRNIALGVQPNDCDVVFKGTKVNQRGILECVREAEMKLKIEPYPEWEFENSMATGQSNDFFENTVGNYANHSDYLTVIMMDTKFKLFTGGEKTLKDIQDRRYDLRFRGVEVWAEHRGMGRSYTSCLVGDLTRGMYLCVNLNVNPSSIVNFLLSHFDSFFNELDEGDKEGRRAYWKKKTKGEVKYKEILQKYGIKSLGII